MFSKKKYKRAGLYYPPSPPSLSLSLPLSPPLSLSQVVRHLRGGVGIPEVSWVGTEGDANIMVQVSLSPPPLLPSLSPSLSLSLSRALSLSLSIVSTWRRNDRKHCNKCKALQLLPYAIVITVLS